MHAILLGVQSGFKLASWFLRGCYAVARLVLMNAMQLSGSECQTCYYVFDRQFMRCSDWLLGCCYSVLVFTMCRQFLF